MRIEINGVPHWEWRYTLLEWWVGDPLSRLPLDGSARLKSGEKSQVAHLRATGKLVTNVAGATARDYVDCDLPIYGLCYEIGSPQGNEP